MRERRVRLPQRATIPSSFLVRALTRHGSRHHCTNCGEVMFVRYESGLCPLCFNGRRPLVGRAHVDGAVERALAGVLDEQGVEEPTTH